MEDVESAIRFQQPPDHAQFFDRVHPKHVDAEKEYLVEAGSVSKIQEISVEDLCVSFGDVERISFQGCVHHFCGSVDGGQFAAREFLANEWNRMTVATADLEYKVVGLNVE